MAKLVMNALVGFQSTLSVRRATLNRNHPARVRQFQSTLSVRRATTIAFETVHLLEISIHALREESDVALAHAPPVEEEISIHALREESDWPSPRQTAVSRHFNPRSP